MIDVRLEPGPFRPAMALASSVAERGSRATSSGPVAGQHESRRRAAEMIVDAIGGNLVRRDRFAIRFDLARKVRIVASREVERARPELPRKFHGLGARTRDKDRR